MCHRKCLIRCFPKPAFRMLGCCHMKGSTGRVTSQYDGVHLLLPEKNTNLWGIRMNHLGISLGISLSWHQKQGSHFSSRRGSLGRAWSRLTGLHGLIQFLPNPWMDLWEVYWYIYLQMNANDGWYVYIWYTFMSGNNGNDPCHWWYPLISTNNQPFMYGKYTNWYMDLMYGKLEIYWKWYPGHVFKLGGDEGILEQQVLNPRELTAWRSQFPRLRRKIIFQSSVIVFHVKFPGCYFNMMVL